MNLLVMWKDQSKNGLDYVNDEKLQNPASVINKLTESMTEFLISSYYVRKEDRSNLINQGG